MKKIEKSRYAILRELTDAALEEAVTAYMNDGWKPVGGLVLVIMKTWSTRNIFNLCQTKISDVAD